MKKEEIDLNELTVAVNRVLGLCKKYSFLWESQEFIEDRYLRLYFGFIAQDESFSIGIKKLNESEKVRFFGKSLCDFVFTGKNFEYFGYERKGVIGRDAARRLRDYKIDADHLITDFFSVLKKPLGKYLADRYLAEKEIDGLKQRLS